MVASKFLHDDGEEDEVFNDEWAKSGAMEKKELNELELNFLSAIDWSIYVSPNEYEQTTQKIELAVALKQVGDRGGWTTYSDLLVRQFSLNNFFLKFIRHYIIKFALDNLFVLQNCYKYVFVSKTENSFYSFFQRRICMNVTFIIFFIFRCYRERLN